MQSQSLLVCYIIILAALAESTKQKHESVNQATQGEVSIGMYIILVWSA